jgi:hypothetical protein
MDIIGVISETAKEPSAQTGQLDSDQDIELLLLASAGAIQRLVAERNALRSRADAQERELTRLRRHVTPIPDSYRRLTTEFVTQFQLIDSAVSSFGLEPTEPAGPHFAEQEPAPDD